jgi:hypothetical protein
LLFKDVVSIISPQYELPDRMNLWFDLHRLFFCYMNFLIAWISSFDLHTNIIT